MSNLGLVTDSDIAKLKSFEKAFEAIQKQLGSLSKIMPELNKVFTTYEKTISSLEKKNDKLVNTVDKLTQAQQKQKTASESNSSVLIRQKNILDGMVAGYSRGESSILATAKAAGIAGGAFKELESVLVKQRQISGKNPFDDTTSSLIKMERQLKVSKQVLSELSQGYASTNKDAAEFIRFQERLKIAVEQAANAYTGPSGKTRALSGGAREAFIEKRIREETAAYSALREEIRKTDKAVSDLADKKNRAAKADEKTKQDLLAVEKQLKRTRIEAELAREGLSRVTATGVAGLQLRGASQESIDSYKKMRLEIEKIQKEAYRTGSALLGLSTIGRELFPALGAVGVLATFGMLTRKVVLTTDAYNLLAARIKLVSAENEKFSDIQEKLFNVATNTRQSFEAIGRLYARLVPALQAVGGSSTDAMIAAEQLAGSMTKSGTSVQEAESAILQFSQALGSGKLAGDEFRALAEAAPDFMRNLAKALGVPTTSMKQLAAEGKLTTEVVSAGTIIMAESFKALGESMPITVGQAFQQLTNVLFIRTSELNNALGGNQGLAKSILELAQSFDSGLKAITSFVKQNEQFVENIFKGVAILTTAVGIFGAYKLAMLALVPIAKAAGAILWAYGSATLALSANTRTATVATTAFSTALKGVGASNWIGLAITGIATGYLFLSESSDEVTKSQEEVAEATKASAQRLEEAKRTAKAFSDEVTGLARGSLKDLIAASDKLYESQLKQNDEGLKLAMGMSDQEFALHKLEVAYVSASVAEKKSMQEKVEQTVVMYEQMIQQQKLNDILKLSVDAEKDYKEQATNLRKEINERTKSAKELKEIEMQLLDVKAATIEADILALTNSKNFNQLTIATIHSRRQELSALREVIGLTEQLNNTPEKPKDPVVSREIDEYKKLNESIKDYISSLAAKSEGLSKAQVYELEYSNLKGKTTAKTREAIQANIAEAKSLELLDNLKKARVEREKELEEFNKNSKSTIDEIQAQINETIYQTKIIGLNAEAIRDLELAKIDDMITTLEYQAVIKSTTGEYAAEVKAIETQINLYRQLREEKAKQFGAQNKDDTRKKEEKILEDQQKEYEKIFEEVGQIFGEALFKGGDDAIKDLGKNIKNYFKTLTIRLAIEPAMKNVGNQIMNLTSGKSFDTASFGKSLQTLSAGSLGGTEGALLNKGLSSIASNLNDEGFRLMGEGFTLMGAEYANLGAKIGNVASYAGSIVQLMKGDAKGAALSGAGTYIGGVIAGPIGAAVGSYLGNMLTGSAKISAKSFGAEFGQTISKDLSKQYLDTVKALGGQAADVSFSAWGNTGRQGQNSNFTVGTSLGGQSLYTSHQSFGGDGLFQSGEIALSDADIAEQSTRAIIAALQKTNFNQAIDNLFDSVDAAKDKIERLNDVLKQVSIVKFLNNNMAMFASNIRNLINVSSDAFGKLTEMAGGTEAFAQALDLYVQSFATDTDKLRSAQNTISESFSALNLSVPKTQQELRGLIDAQDLTTEAGRRTYLSLMSLIPAFTEVTNISSQFKQAQDALSNSLNKSMVSIQNEFSTMLLKIQERTDSLSGDSFTSVISSLQTVLDSISPAPVLDFVNTISNTVPSSALYKSFISEIGSTQPDTYSFENFVSNISSLSPNGAAYNAFISAVSGAKPTDLAYKDFVSSVSGLKPSDSLYNSFVNAVSSLKPSDGLYSSFVNTISGLKPSDSLYNSFVNSISGLKPNDSLYTSFVNTISGLKPSESLYTLFVNSISGLKPTDTAYKDFVNSISASVPNSAAYIQFANNVSLSTAGVNSAINSLVSQIDTMKNTVTVVDFSKFTREVKEFDSTISQLKSSISNTSDFGVRLQLEDQLQAAIVARYTLEKELLGSIVTSISDLFSKVKEERIAVRESAIEIWGGVGVMSTSQIRGGIAGAASLSQLPSSLSLGQIDSNILNLTNALQDSILNKSSFENQLKQAQFNLNKEISVAKTAVGLFNQRSAVGSAYATSSSGGRATASFDQATLRAALDYAYITYNIGDEASVARLRDQLRTDTSNSGLNGETILGAIGTANQDIISAQQQVTQASEGLANSLIEVANNSARLTEAENSRVVAQQKFAEDLQRFVIDSGKATAQLGRLRNETVKYYQEQQRLAGALSSSSQGIRQTLSDIRFAGLSQQQQLDVLLANFSGAVAKASVSTGDALAEAGNELNNLINPLLQKAQEVYASGQEFQNLKQTVLAYSESIASRIEQLTPVDYQRESLSLLNDIDSTLALIEGNTASAEQLIVDAIGMSTDRTVNALGAIYAGITGESIPQFANGGYVSGAGTGTSDSITARLSNGEYVMPASTVSNLGVSVMDGIRAGKLPVAQGNSDNSALIAEVRALRKDVANTGTINIKVVTEDGKTLVNQTINQIKERSRNNELVIYSTGVK